MDLKDELQQASQEMRIVEKKLELADADKKLELSALQKELEKQIQTDKQEIQNLRSNHEFEVQQLQGTIVSLQNINTKMQQSLSSHQNCNQQKLANDNMDQQLQAKIQLLDKQVSQLTQELEHSKHVKQELLESQTQVKRIDECLQQERLTKAKMQETFRIKETDLHQQILVLQSQQQLQQQQQQQQLQLQGEEERIDTKSHIQNSKKYENNNINNQSTSSQLIEKYKYKHSKHAKHNKYNIQNNNNTNDNINMLSRSLNEAHLQYGSCQQLKTASFNFNSAQDLNNENYFFDETSTIICLQQKVERLEATIMTQRQQILQSQDDQAQNNTLLQHQQQHSLMHKLKKVESQISSYEEICSQQQDQIKHLKHLVKQHETTISEKIKEANTLEHISIQHQAQMEKYNDLCAKQESIMRDCEEKKQVISEININVQELEGKLSQKDDCINELQKLMDGQKGQLDSLVQEYNVEMARQMQAMKSMQSAMAVAEDNQIKAQQIWEEHVKLLKSKFAIEVQDITAKVGQFIHAYEDKNNQINHQSVLRNLEKVFEAYRENTAMLAHKEALVKKHKEIIAKDKQNITKAHKAIEALQCQVQELKELNIQQQRKPLYSTIKQQQHQSSSQQSIQQQIQQQCNHLNQSISKMVYQRQDDEYYANCVELEATILTLNSEIRQQKGQIAQLTDMLCQQTALCEETHMENINLQKQAKEGQKENACEVKRLKMEIQKLKDKKDKNQNGLSENQSLIMSGNSNSNTNSQQKENTSNNQNLLNTQNQKNNNDLNSVTKHLKEDNIRKKEMITTLRAQKDAQIKDMQIQLDKIGNLEAELLKQNKTSAQLRQNEQKLKEVYNQNQEYKVALSKYESDLASLHEKHKACKQDLQRKEILVQELKDKMETLLGELDSLKSENQNATCDKSTVSKLKKDIERLDGSNKGMKAKNAQLQQQITDQIEKHSKELELEHRKLNKTRELEQVTKEQYHLLVGLVKRVYQESLLALVQLQIGLTVAKKEKLQEQRKKQAKKKQNQMQQQLQQSSSNSKYLSQGLKILHLNPEEADMFMFQDSQSDEFENGATLEQQQKEIRDSSEQNWHLFEQEFGGNEFNVNCIYNLMSAAINDRVSLSSALTNNNCIDCNQQIN